MADWKKVESESKRFELTHRRKFRWQGREVLERTMKKEKKGANPNPYSPKSVADASLRGRGKIFYGTGKTLQNCRAEKRRSANSEKSENLEQRAEPPQRARKESYLK